MVKAHACFAFVALLILGTNTALTKSIIASDPVEQSSPIVEKCNHKDVQIKRAAMTDEHDFCRPLSKVLAYFRSMGFEIEPKFSLVFIDPPADNPVASYGTFDAASNEIAIYRRHRKKAWGVDWNESFFDSVVIHEMVHMATLRVMGEQYARLPKEWHEFIAYAVQLQLIEEPLLGRVLEQYADVEQFSNLIEINPYIYGLSEPELFAVRAYKTFRTRGGMQFLKKLLRLEFRPPLFHELFPLEPH